MASEEIHQAIQELKQFARRWNELYAAQKFEQMKESGHRGCWDRQCPKIEGFNRADLWTTGLLQRNL